MVGWMLVRVTGCLLEVLLVLQSALQLIGSLGTSSVNWGCDIYGGLLVCFSAIVLPFQVSSAIVSLVFWTAAGFSFGFFCI